jgi:hypothetical protein
MVLHPAGAILSHKKEKIANMLLSSESMTQRKTRK